MKKFIISAITILLIISIGIVAKQFLTNNKSTNYRIATTGPVENYNPVLGLTENNSKVISQVNDTLYAVDGDKLIPSGAAEEPIVSADKLKYTFKIRENYWVDNKGEKKGKVTAKDYEFSIKSLADPNTKSDYATLVAEANIKNAIKINEGEMSVDNLGVKAIDENTLEIELETATPYLTELLAYSKFAPISVENVKLKGGIENAFKAYSDAWYSGAYYISEEYVNEKYILTKNTHFHDAKNVEINVIENKVMKEADTVYKEFTSGNLDQAEVIKKEDIDKVKQEPTTLKVKQGSIQYLTFNLTNPILQDINIRKAIQMGIDYQKIVEETMNLGPTSLDSYTAVGLTMPTYNVEYTNFVGKVKNYDLEEAKKYVELAKQKNEKIKFRLLTQESVNEKKFGELLQDQIKQNLGFEIVLETLPVKEYYIKTKDDSSSYDMMIAGWTADYADPGTFLSTLNPKNVGLDLSRSEDFELSKLIEEAQLESDVTKRLEKFAIAERRAAYENVYVIPYQQNVKYIATNGKYKIKPNSIKTNLHRFIKNN